jgi:hypothetical protein
MPKPTFASVTEQACSCGYLEQSANDPALPIKYDPHLNEYHFWYHSPCGDNECEQRNASLVIYHCPFCGGAAPESKRALLFAVIPPEEERRLCKMLGQLKTIDEAIQVLGPPDEDMPYGWTERHPETEETASTVESFRTLRYSRLSETANVFIMDTRAGPVHFCLCGKYLGSPRS